MKDTALCTPMQKPKVTSAKQKKDIANTRTGWQLRWSSFPLPMAACYFGGTGFFQFSSFSLNAGKACAAAMFAGLG